MNLPQSELFVSTNSLKPGVNPPDDPSNNPMIPLKVLPLTVPQVITTTKTLRRFCGFALALCGFIFYCIRATGLIVWLGVKYYKGRGDGSLAAVGGLEALACGLGIGMFFRIMKYPHLTLESKNIKNVLWFFLIPLVSFFKSFIPSISPSLILPALEITFYTVYVYGLSLNGRSSSMWAGFKPYRYEMVPLILPIPPASRAFPQYTVPLPK